MQNPPTFLPYSYSILFRKHFILKANHSATNVDIAVRNTTRAYRRKGKGKYRNLLTAVFCSYETGNILETGKTWSLFRKDNMLKRSKICETSKKIFSSRKMRARSVEIEDKTMCIPRK